MGVYENTDVNGLPPLKRYVRKVAKCECWVNSYCKSFTLLQIAVF